MADTMISAGGGLSKTKLALANAAESDVLSGKRFYAGDKIIKEGKMPNRGSWGATIDPGNSVTVPAGYHDGNGQVYATTKGVKNIKTKTVSSGNVASGAASYSFTYTVTEGTLIGVTSVQVHHWYESNSAVVNCYVSGNTIHVDTTFAGGTLRDISCTFAYY